MTPPKVTLDAMLDQSFARIREERSIAPPELVDLGTQGAAILAEQFPGQQDTAGRVVMAVVQILAGLAHQMDEEAADVIDAATDILALAAEQIVREGRQP